MDNSVTLEPHAVWKRLLKGVVKIVVWQFIHWF